MTKAERKAYLCRIRNGIKEFPITYDGMLQIMREMGFKVLKYSEAKQLISEENWEECAANSPAFSGKVKGIFTVFIADNLNYEDRVEKIAHELGHIEQGHATDDIKSNEQHQEEEDEANEFVPYFLAPPCYLDQLGLKTLEDVEEALPYSTKYCKLIFANLAAYQLRHEPMAYEERTICSMMEKPIISESKISEEQPQQFPAPISVASQFDLEPCTVPAHTKRIWVGMSVIMVTMLCAIFFFIGQNVERYIQSATLNSIQSQQGQSSNSLESSESKEPPVSLIESESNSDFVSQSSESKTPEPAVDSQSESSTMSESRVVSIVEGEGTLVYVTRTGNKYHKWGCQYISGKTNLNSMYISEAQQKDYLPCSLCFPK
ncbi:MAG: hypothetical protein DBY45_10090 [Clostridiales bacterium]|nr:MAG: hypothetical protein DBY45_10090 [Clostridiales bacterium]